MLKRTSALLTLILLALVPALARGQGLLNGLGQGGDEEPVVTVSASFFAQAGKPGRLMVTAKIKPTWHIYSITQAAGGPVPTKIELEPASSYRLAGEFKALTPPHSKKEAVFDNLLVESHEGEATWEVPIEVLSADPAAVVINGKLRAQPCDPQSCMPPTVFPFQARFDKALAPAAAPPTPVASAPAITQPPAPIAASAPPPPTGKLSLIGALLYGFIGGFILNFMPCVLPVIGLKILAFIQQAGQNRSQAFVLNVWYSAGIIAVFMVLAALAAFAGFGWGQLFTYRGFNVTLATVVFAMALSFLGIWEIPTPSFVGRGSTAKLAEREGASGAFAKGVLTTVIATPCGAPLLASAVTWAVGQPIYLILAVFAAAGLGMAAPYLVIGAFPEVMRFLPKPGAWMDTFKQLMGFVLLGTVVFLLVTMPLPAAVPTVALMFIVWIACWWLARTPPTEPTPAQARAWGEALVVVAFGAVLVYPWVAQIMQAKFDDKVNAKVEAAVQLVQSQAGKGAAPQITLAVNASSPLATRIDALVGGNKTVLVDFTADWCLTCKTLEKLILQSDAVTRKLTENGVVSLTADWSEGAPDVTEMLDRLGSKQVPVIAIFPAGDVKNPIIFRGAYTQQQILDALAKAGPSKG